MQPAREGLSGPIQIIILPAQIFTCMYTTLLVYMAAILEKGYNTTGFKVLSKDGQDLDEKYLKRYQCVICGNLLREASQLLCGDRICKCCFPSK